MVDTKLLRELHAKATPGEWHVNHDRPDDRVSQLSISNGDARIIANVVTHERTHGLDGGGANAELIVAARNDLLALCDAYDERERLRTERERLRTALFEIIGMAEDAPRKMIAAYAARVLDGGTP